MCIADPDFVSKKWSKLDVPRFSFSWFLYPTNTGFRSQVAYSRAECTVEAVVLEPQRTTKQCHVYIYIYTQPATCTYIYVQCIYTYIYIYNINILCSGTRSQFHTSVNPTTIQWISNGGWLTLSCWLAGVGPVAVPQKMRNPLAALHRDWRRNYDQRWAQWLPVSKLKHVKTSIQTVSWYQAKMSFMSFPSFHQIPG